MDKLIKLVSLCKASVSVTVNDHKDYYMSVEDYLKDRAESNEVERSIIQKMIELDTVVCIQFYPRTPIGFHIIWHYDIDMAMDIALNHF